MSREVIVYGNELYHHGVKGQKWGIRRYQNEDGSLTAEGKKRLGYSDNPTTLVGTIKKNIIDSRLIGTKYKGLHKLGMTRSFEQTAKTEENWGKYYENKAKSTKNKFLKNMHEASSFNSKQFSKYYKQAMNYSTADKIFKAGTMIDSKYRNMKVKNLFIKDLNMTLGEQYLMSEAMSRTMNSRI